jgi:protein-tyrosine-phosphatase
MKKMLSMISHLAEALRERFTRRDSPNEELEWDVEDPYEESMFQQIRSANAAKSASAAK